MRSKRRVIGIIIAVVFVFLMSAFLLSNNLIEAQGTKDKQFTSIQVQKGDTLWKIAKKYMGLCRRGRISGTCTRQRQGTSVGRLSFFCAAAPVAG